MKRMGLLKILVVLTFFSFGLTANAEWTSTVRPIGAYQENSSGDVTRDLGNVRLRVTTPLKPNQPQVIKFELLNSSNGVIATFLYRKGQSVYSYEYGKGMDGKKRRLLHLISTDRRNEVISMFVPDNYDDEGSIFFNYINLNTGNNNYCYELVFSNNRIRKLLKNVAEAVDFLEMRTNDSKSGKIQGYLKSNAAYFDGLLSW